MNQQTKDKLDKLRDTITNEYAPLFKSESLSCYTLTGDMLTGRSRADFQQGFDALSPIVLELVQALQDIQSTKKSDLLANPAYWGQMIVGRSSEALSNFDKFLEGKK